MIPKIIHYCWFGGNPLPKSAEKCIKSWKKYCKGYEIIEWNEDNFDISACPLYVRQAYQAKKWAFVTDYVRLKVVYEHGGIYMDTDVELKKPLDSLLEYSAYFGFEDGLHINTGHGFGSAKGLPLLKEIMDDYENIPFLNSEGTVVACPRINTAVFLKHGLIQEDRMQTIDNNVLILPTEYLCPKSVIDGIVRQTPNTYSIHHYDSSWFTKEAQLEKQESWRRLQKMIRRDYILHTPNRLLKKLLGEGLYKRIKCAFGKNFDQ